MKIERFPENPLISPADVQPSRPDFEVACVFNAGVARYHDQVILLMRVAERPRTQGNIVRTPVLNCAGDKPFLDILEFDINNPNFNFDDQRKIFTPEKTFLTTISYLRIARSFDGRHFIVDPAPALFPDRPEEAYGLEDPRITEIDGVYYICYKSVSEHGITVSLATTSDFIHFEKHGIIFCPENMDVCIFPEKIGGRYVALHRPVSLNIADMNIWLASSHDLISWGDHRFVMGVRPGKWDNGRIGAGTVPVKTEHGWLEIFHGASHEDLYCLGAVLLDIKNPHKVIARLDEPIIAPKAVYETSGFMPNVVFSAGAIIDSDVITIYYGAADEVICACQLNVNELLYRLLTVK